MKCKDCKYIGHEFETPELWNGSVVLKVSHCKNTLKKSIQGHYMHTCAETKCCVHFTPKPPEKCKTCGQLLEEKT